jgi:hypothetical protein
MSNTVAIVAAQRDASFGDIVKGAESQKVEKHCVDSLQFGTV